MDSKMFKLNVRDVSKGFALAVITAVMTWLLQILDAPGFSVYQIDWTEIGRIAFAAGVSYLIKNYLSDGQGRIMGSIG